jgi:hypothetical protein
MRWAGHIAFMRGKEECLIGFLVGKPEGTRPAGRHICRWEVIIKMALRSMG